ncbi:hypothetical protein NKH77_06185 [Streptomyces sp. M19]
MGTVYLSHTRGGQPVALKLIRREFGRDEGSGAASSRRSRRPTGCTATTWFRSSTTTSRGTPWVASEFVPGLALDDALEAHGPLPPTAVFQLMGCAALALGAIHAAGVVHRDLKPSNVMLAASGRTSSTSASPGPPTPPS